MEPAGGFRSVLFFFQYLKLNSVLGLLTVALGGISQAEGARLTFQQGISEVKVRALRSTLLCYAYALLALRLHCARVAFFTLIRCGGFRRFPRCSGCDYTKLSRFDHVNLHRTFLHGFSVSQFLMLGVSHWFLMSG